MKQLLNRAEFFDTENATFYSVKDYNPYTGDTTLLNYKTKKNEIVSIERFDKMNEVPKKYSVIKALFLGENGNFKYLRNQNGSYLIPLTDEYGQSGFESFSQNKYTYTILDYMSLPFYWLKIDKTSINERKTFKKVIKALKKDEFPDSWTWDLDSTIVWVLSEGLEKYLKLSKNEISLKKEDEADIKKIIKTFKNYNKYQTTQKEIAQALKLLSKHLTKLWW